MPRVAITVSGKNSQPYRFQLDRKKVTIGRSSNNDIVIDCPSVSSLHCTMERVEGGYILRDRESTNGLKLDDEEMAIIDLRNDSEVYVGDAEFDYTLSEDELDELDDEDFEPHAKKSSEKGSSKSDDSDDADEDDFDDEDEDDEPRPKKKKQAKVLAAPARAATPTPAPAIAATSGGGGSLFTIAIVVCGLLALYGGLDSSYRGKQEKLGREGEFSLIKDIFNGRPALPEAAADEE